MKRQTDFPPLPTDDVALFAKLDRARSLVALAAVQIDGRASCLFDRIEREIAPIENKRRRMEEAIARLKEAAA